MTENSAISEYLNKGTNLSGALDEIREVVTYDELVAPEHEFGPLEFPPGYVESFYRLDPATDDLIYGHQLTEGMMVFVEKSPFGVDLKKFFDTAEEDRSPYDVEKVEVEHRWCLISNLQRYGEILKFIAIYEDGTKHSRTYNQSYAWFVKKASI